MFLRDFMYLIVFKVVLYLTLSFWVDCRVEVIYELSFSWVVVFFFSVEICFYRTLDLIWGLFQRGLLQQYNCVPAFSSESSSEWTSRLDWAEIDWCETKSRQVGVLCLGRNSELQGGKWLKTQPLKPPEL